MTRLDEIKKRCEAYKWHIESSSDPINAESNYSNDVGYLLSLVEKQAQTIAIFLDIISFRENFRSAKNDVWHLECMMDELYRAAQMTPGEAADYVKNHIVNFQMAQTIQAIRSLCLDPKEKDGCQTVGARVVRLCDEALEGK